MRTNMAGAHARWKAALCLTTVCGSALLVAAPVKAQQLEEIIVTARKRQESILNVPVVETAIPQAQLQRFQTQDLKDVATLVPGLALGDNILSIGTQVSIRGVGTNSFDPGVDQSVSLNIDGLQVSQGLAYASAMFDLGQVEVLKGPQALFYGKSSPAGVISLRSADPTDRFEVIARTGYEFEANEKQGQIIVSGPINDTLKARLAAQYDTSDGFFDNGATALTSTGALPPSSSTWPVEKSYFIRGTVLWRPTAEFDARLKINQAHDRTLYSGTAEYVDCPEGTTAPFGIPFIGGNNVCSPTLGRTAYVVDMNPTAFPGITNEGVPYLETTQSYGTLELNYRPRPDLTVTSVTGYYLLHATSLVNTSASTYAAPAIFVTNGFERHDVTEEVRVNSDFTGPLNFTAGGFYQRGGFNNLIVLGGNTALRLPPLLGTGSNHVDIDSKSLFGQFRWKLTSQLELAAGARWTDETRELTAFNLITGTPVPVTVPTPQIHSNNTSPEVTLTYKPGVDWTVFGSLKRGFKSGSYDVGTPTTSGEGTSFGDEKVEGYEIGMKGRMLDRCLAMDLAFYDYRYSGLQVGSVIDIAGVPSIKTVNAGSSLVYGVDYDIAYRPELIEGLGLQAQAEWNQAKFKTLDNAPCYGGQTVAAGCNLAPNAATGLDNAQNLSGSPLLRAPKWQVNFGFDYEHDIGNDLKLVLSNTNSYSSRYNTDLDDPFYQKAFIKSDVSITLQGPKDRWEFALIGKDLNNAITTGLCNNFNGQGGVVLGGQVTGGTGRGPAGLDEIACFPDRGREVWLRLTLKPFS